ncbi:hypothetical protein GQ54DRAFT_222472 [Martensiomyces pterosporus]|nr:hypothetical protein GQ54DRAFT_222472 [Martensiomyces pterosporus]
MAAATAAGCLRNQCAETKKPTHLWQKSRGASVHNSLFLSCFLLLLLLLLLETAAQKSKDSMCEGPREEVRWRAVNGDARLKSAFGHASLDCRRRA